MTFFKSVLNNIGFSGGIAVKYNPSDMNTKSPQIIADDFGFNKANIPSTKPSSKPSVSHPNAHIPDVTIEIADVPKNPNKKIPVFNTMDLDKLERDNKRSQKQMQYIMIGGAVIALYLLTRK